MNFTHSNNETKQHTTPAHMRKTTQGHTHTHTHLRLGGDLYPVESVRQRVDHYEHVAELGRYDATPVVPRVLWPHYVHLIIAKVTGLGWRRREANHYYHYLFPPGACTVIITTSTVILIFLLSHIIIIITNKSSIASLFSGNFPVHLTINEQLQLQVSNMKNED